MPPSLPIISPLPCLSIPPSSDHIIFHCGLCSRHTSFPHFISRPTCSFCDHTHLNSPPKSCLTCRIFDFDLFYECWACGTTRRIGGGDSVRDYLLTMSPTCFKCHDVVSSTGRWVWRVSVTKVEEETGRLVLVVGRWGEEGVFVEELRVGEVEALELRGT